MAIPNYTQPQLNVEQLLDLSIPGTPPPTNAVVIGPRYLLSRYGVEEGTPGYEFDADGSSIPWEYAENGVATPLPSGYAVDTDSVKVQGVGLEASLAHYTNATTPKFYLTSLSTPSILRINGGGNVAGTGLDTLLRDRPVTVGDIVYVNDGVSGLRRRVVTGLQGVDIAAHYGTNGGSDDENFANSSYNPLDNSPVAQTNPTIVTSPAGLTLTVDDVTDFNALVEGAKFNGYYGEQFTITVHTPGAPGVATVNISSASGLFSATNVATTDSTGDYGISNSDAGGALAGLDLTIAPDSTEELEIGQTFVFNVYGVYERLSTSQIVGSDAGSGYTGTLDTVYSIEVIEGTASGVTGAVVRVSSSNGVDPTTEVTLTNNTNFSVGAFGLLAKIDFTSAPDQGGLRTGDVYYVNAFAASQSTTAFDKVILNGPASDTALFTNLSTPIDTEFRLPFTGNIAASDGPVGSPAWAASGSALTVNAALSLYVSSRASGFQWVNYVDEVGELYPSFRALIPLPANAELIPIEDEADILSSLGSIDLDNPLAYGASRALFGAGGLIYALPTGGTDAEDFTDALTIISARDDTYALAPMTDDLDVMGAVRAHCVSMSSAQLMHWRRCYVGSDSPGTYPVLQTTSAGGPYTATVGTVSGQNLLVAFTNSGVNLETSDIDPGDLLHLSSDGGIYEIDEVISATELMLVTGPAAPVSPAVPVEVWKANTPQSQMTFIINRSRALNHRRCVHVWQENGTQEIGGVSTVVPNQFVAAEIAGLRTAVLPQQGLTKRAISTISACPAMYSRYSEQQLNEVAANGTCIITQDTEAGNPYIRHQLTTEPNEGILYYEDSVGVNVDNVAFGIKSILQGYIGRYNVNRRTINAVQSVVASYLQGLTTADVTTTIGPQLNGIGRLEISIPAGQADTISIWIQVFVPVPLNRILVTLQASIDPLTGVVTTEILPINPLTQE